MGSFAFRGFATGIVSPEPNLKGRKLRGKKWERCVGAGSDGLGRDCWGWGGRFRSLFSRCSCPSVARCGDGRRRGNELRVGVLGKAVLLCCCEQCSVHCQTLGLCWGGQFAGRCAGCWSHAKGAGGRTRWEGGASRAGTRCAAILGCHHPGETKFFLDLALVYMIQCIMML